MMKIRTFFALLAATAVGPLAAWPVAAQSVQASAADAGQFVDHLTDTAFSALRTTGGAPATQAQRAQFRALLRQNFAVKAIGDRLIRRWQSNITPAQYAAYTAAFPDFVINTYADRLYDYASADLKVARVVPVGSGWAVYSRVTKPGGQAFDAVWSVVRGGSGYQITNLTVAGINLALTQSADFDSYIQRNGFDALVTFMKTRHG